MDQMTEEQRSIVEELRKRTINEVSSKMLEDDSVFYRFAKARDFDLEEAEAMLRKHISWRKEWEIDSILTDYDPPEVLLKYGCSSFVCFDKVGDIVRIQDFGRIDGKGLCNSANKFETTKIAVYYAEQDKALKLKRGRTMGKPFQHLIYDFEDLTYQQALNVKALQYWSYSLKVLLDNYPETMKLVTMINVPVYFSWVYAAIKPIIPPVVTQKIRIYGTDGWKEALLKDIDADDLPAYLGGNKTDPDGNPLCETFIQRGKPIPKRYYKHHKENRLILASDVKKLTLKPLSKEEISLHVKENNSYLDWELEIIKGDIDFSLKFMGGSSENFKSVELLPKRRIETSIASEKDCFKCERTGIYTFVFDNSYSWLHTKEIYYRIEMKKLKNNELYDST